MLLNDGYVYREKLGSPPGKSALAYLTAKYRHSTEAQWRARFERGEVELDGQRAEGSELLQTGQWLCWHRPPWEEADTPQDFGLVYEDAELLGVVKPSGLPTLPSGGFLKNTLLSFVQARWPEAIPMHRLGRATSGLVLFTRTREAASRVASDWREGRVHKRYRALSQGLAAQEAYDIQAPIGLVPHPLLGEVHGALASGKASHSVARVLQRRQDTTLFEVDIHTGRPEQIRIHLAFIGHPLVGDPLFAAGGLPLTDAPGLPGDCGYLLHAESLAFAHPRTGEPVQLHAPPPSSLSLWEREA